MKETKLYEVYKTSHFSDMRQEKVAIFYDLGLARDFVDYQATFGNSYAVFFDGKEVYPND